MQQSRNLLHLVVIWPVVQVDEDTSPRRLTRPLHSSCVIYTRRLRLSDDDIFFLNEKFFKKKKMKQKSARRRGLGGDIRLSDMDPSDVRIIDSEMRVCLYLFEVRRRAA